MVDVELRLAGLVFQVCPGGGGGVSAIDEHSDGLIDGGRICGASQSRVADGRGGVFVENDGAGRRWSE